MMLRSNGPTQHQSGFIPPINHLLVAEPNHLETEGMKSMVALPIVEILRSRPPHPALSMKRS